MPFRPSAHLLSRAVLKFPGVADRSNRILLGASLQILSAVRFVAAVNKLVVKKQIQNNLQSGISLGKLGLFAGLLAFALEVSPHNLVQADPVEAGLINLGPEDSQPPVRHVQNRPASGFYQRLKAGAVLSAKRAAENVFSLGEVSIEGQYYRSKEEIISLLGAGGAADGADAGRISLFNAYQTDSIGRLKSDPWFSEVRSEWSVFPLALKIHVTEREPWIVAEYAGEPWLISRTGIPIQPTRTIKQTRLAVLTSNLPRLDGLDPLPGSDSNLSSPSIRLAFAAKLLRLVESAGPLPYTAERFTLDSDGNLAIQPMDIAHDPVILLGPGDFKSISSRLKDLHTVVADLKKRGEHPKKIDLRFQDQIIVE